MTDGAPSPGLDELSRHLRGMAHRLWTYMSAYIYQKTGKVVVIIWDALESGKCGTWACWGWYRILSPVPLGEMSKWLWGAQLPARLNRNVRLHGCVHPWYVWWNRNRIWSKQVGLWLGCGLDGSFTDLWDPVSLFKLHVAPMVLHKALPCSILLVQCSLHVFVGILRC